jgi:hypothetical protein
LALSAFTIWNKSDGSKRKATSYHWARQCGSKFGYTGERDEKAR